MKKKDPKNRRIPQTKVEYRAFIRRFARGFEKFSKDHPEAAEGAASIKDLVEQFENLEHQDQELRAKRRIVNSDKRNVSKELNKRIAGAIGFLEGYFGSASAKHLYKEQRIF